MPLRSVIRYFKKRGLHEEKRKKMFNRSRDWIDWNIDWIDNRGSDNRWIGGFMNNKKYKKGDRILIIATVTDNQTGTMIRAVTADSGEVVWITPEDVEREE